MTIVLDASVLVAALIDDGPTGDWADHLVAREPLVAPHHLPVEVSNILRRAALAGTISRDQASLAFTDLIDLDVDLVPFEPLADRIWELRHNITPYDAWYVALAEALDLPLATLDLRLANAPADCRFLLPPAR